MSAFEGFLGTPTAHHFTAERRLVSTRKLTPAERELVSPPTSLDGPSSAEIRGEIYEHERIAFPSYPYEWPPEMVHAAGRLTMEFALDGLADGYGLKDATPYNVLFRGSEPVFVDVLSFEKRTPGTPLWKPYAQFVRTFLLPLLANQRWGLPMADIFYTHRDGLEPEMIYRWCGLTQRLLPPFIGLVSLPTWLASRGQDVATHREHRLADAAKAEFVLTITLKRLIRALAGVKPKRNKHSTWSDYMTTHSYTDASFKAKEEFVRAALNEAQPHRVLDVGANTGHFSVLAAKCGAAVVAIDSDPNCAGEIWQRAREQALDILPLVVDFARPSPTLGWRNREYPSFLERACGGFDCVLMLAVLHHLLVSERVPLAEVLSLAAELTTGYLLIEFVAPEDAMFRRIARGRDHLHAGLDVAAFESACHRHFDIIRSIRLDGTCRWLYWLSKKMGNP